MTTRDVLFVAIVVTGLLCAVFGAAAVPSAVSTMSHYASSSSVGRVAPLLGASFLLWPVIITVSGLLMVGLRHRLADWLTPEDHAVTGELPEGWEPTFFSLALRIIGALTILRTLPTVISLSIALSAMTFQGGSVSPSSDWISRYYLGTALGNLAGLAIGVYFVTGGRWLVRKVYRDVPPLEPVDD